MDNKKQEDLDMLYILRSIKRSIGRMAGSVTWLIRYSVQHWLRLMLFVVISVAALVGLYFLKKGYYESTLVVAHSRIDNDNCREMIASLATYIDGRENENLAGVLGISRRYAREIRSIAYKPLNENLAKRFADSVHVLLPFKVEVEIYDQVVLDSLQNGLMNYLENNDFAVRRKIIDMESLAKSQEWLSNETKEIDSLKRLVNLSIIPRGTGTGIVFGEPIDPVNVYRRAMELFERKLQIEKRQRLISSFEVMVAFNRSAKRADTGGLAYVAIGILLGYIIGLVWLLNREFRASRTEGLRAV